MAKEKKPQQGSGSGQRSSRGASKRPVSSFVPARKARKKTSAGAQKRGKTDQAVRKAADRALKRNSSPAQRPSSSSLSQRISSTSPKRNTSNARQTSPRPSTERPARNTGASTRKRGASVRTAGASTTKANSSTWRNRSMSSQRVRESRAAQTRQLTAAEKARQKRTRNLLFIFLILLAFLIAVIAVFRYVTGRIQEESTIVLNDEQSSFAPVACTPEMVNVSIDVDAPVDTNVPITFVVNLHNTSKDNPCYIDVGREHTELNIMSGDDQIAALSTCADAGVDTKQLLIDRDMGTSFALTWNRHRGNECKAESATALPGVYKATWNTRGDNPLASEVTFEVKEPPKPTPTETEQPEQSEQSEESIAPEQAE